jgi:protein arginine kinase
MRDASRVPLHGMEWIAADGPHADIVLSTRVRLARNLKDFPFGLRSGEDERDAVLELTRAAAEQSAALAEGTAIAMSALQPMSRRLLLERHLVSTELVGEEGAEPPRGAALLLAAEESLGIMVNEEDHLRLQSLVSGFRLREAWSKVDRLDEELATRLRYAFHPSSASSPRALPTWGPACAHRS